MGSSSPRASAMTGFRNPVRSSPLVCLAMLSCQADEPELPSFSIETKRARIALDHDHAADPLCKGDLDHIDAQVARVEEFLAVKRTEPVSIYLGGVDEFCSDPESLRACYRGDIDWIFTDWASLDHEIVHAVARHIDFPSLFWSEGTATLLSAWSHKDRSAALTPALLDAPNLTNYVSVAHFSHYIVETYGRESFNRIIRGEPLEQVLGMSATEATERYEDEVPYAYPSLNPCPYPPLPSVGEGQWEETVAFDCDSPDTSTFEFTGHSNSIAPVLLRSVSLDAGEYEFDFDGAIASSYVLLGCVSDVLDVETTPPSNGDLFNELDTHPGTLFPSTGRQLLQLTAGTYRVGLVGTHVPPPNGVDATATFTVTRVE